MYTEISFPGLGITLNPSRIAFYIGGKAIYWYGIIIAVGFLLAVCYAMYRAKDFGLTQDNVIDMLIFAVPLGIIGARLYYCAFSWDYYSANPVKILYIWEGGLAIYGGVIGAVIGLALNSLIHRVPAAPMLDIGGMGLLIGQSIGRWGNFFNREAFGTASDGLLRMGIMDAYGNITYHHPTFLYESAWNLLGFFIISRASYKRRYDGQVWIMYLGWYGLGRLFIEGLRTDSLYVGNTNLRISQLVAGLCLLAAVILLFYFKVFKEMDAEAMYVNRIKNDVSTYDIAADLQSEECEDNNDNEYD